MAAFSKPVSRICLLQVSHTDTVHRLLEHVSAEYVWLWGYMNFIPHALVPTPAFLPPTPHYRICWHHARSWYSKGPQPTRNSEENEVPRHRQNEHHWTDRQGVSSAMRLSHVDGDEEGCEEEEYAGAEHAAASAFWDIAIR